MNKKDLAIKENQTNSDNLALNVFEADSDIKSIRSSINKQAEEVLIPTFGYFMKSDIEYQRQKQREYAKTRNIQEDNYIMFLAWLDNLEKIQKEAKRIWIKWNIISYNYKTITKNILEISFISEDDKISNIDYEIIFDQEKWADKRPTKITLETKLKLKLIW